MFDTIHFKGENYLSLQATHNSARFILPFAKELCTGAIGFDIGYGRKEWQLPDTIGVDSSNADEWHALNLPPMLADYIFSSHCLEHIPDWAGVLLYWITRLKRGGVLFLYLPDHSQKYWRPQFNRKHVNSFTPDIIRPFLIDSEAFETVFVSGIDLNNSFAAVAKLK